MAFKREDSNALEDKIVAERQSVVMPLAPPIGPPRRIMQQLTAVWPGHQERFICVLELDSQHIAMVGQTGEGMSLFNLIYDGKTLKSDKNPLLPDSVVPEFIIADLQLVYWPTAAVQKIIPKNWTFMADRYQRRLYHHNELRVDVHYLEQDAIWPKRVELVNHRYNYRLQIKTISYEALSE